MQMVKLTKEQKTYLIENAKKSYFEAMDLGDYHIS